MAIPAGVGAGVDVTTNTLATPQTLYEGFAGPNRGIWPSNVGAYQLQPFRIGGTTLADDQFGGTAGEELGADQMADIMTELTGVTASQLDDDSLAEVLLRFRCAGCHSRC